MLGVHTFHLKYIKLFINTEIIRHFKKLCLEEKALVADQNVWEDFDPRLRRSLLQWK